MRYSRLTLALLALLLGAFSGKSAFTQVSMDFTGVGGANGGGVYTYPYYFSINNGPQTSLICDSFDNHIQVPETWTANVNSLLTAGNLGEGYFTGMQSAYDEAGLIFEAILTGAVNEVQGNWAIWGLFSSTARNSSFWTTAGPNNSPSPSSIASTYLTDLNNYGANLPAFLANMVVYTPVGGVAGGTGPQEFIGVVPEPGTMALFGSALALFGGVLRKRLIPSRS